jgi:hypothetical protein
MCVWLWEVWGRKGEQAFLLHIASPLCALGFSITCQRTGERRLERAFVARRTTDKRRGVESRFDDVAVGLSITCKYL